MNLKWYYLGRWQRRSTSVKVLRYFMMHGSGTHDSDQDCETSKALNIKNPPRVLFLYHLRIGQLWKRESLRVRDRGGAGHLGQWAGSSTGQV